MSTESRVEAIGKGDEVAVRAKDVRDRSRVGEYASLDDRMLVLDFQAGNEDTAYREIYRRYSGLARHVALRILADGDAAQEVVQETMLRVYQGLPRFNGRYLLQPWVAKIATNVALDVLRTRQRRPQLSDRPLTDLDPEPMIHADELDEEVERILERDAVLRVLSELPEHHRTALVQREFDGRSHEEIAADLGLTAPQAKALIHRAKGSFRRAWDGTTPGGLAGLLPWYLIPNVFRRVQEASQSAGVRIATSPALQSVAPTAASDTAATLAERVTAVAVAVAVVGTVGAGAVAVKHARDSDKPAPAPPAVIAPAPVPDTAAPTVVITKEQKKADRKAERAKARAKAAAKAEARAAAAAAAAAAEPVADPAPTPDPASTASASPDPAATPAPPPPAPAWSGGFTSSARLGAASLALASTKIGVDGSGSEIFSQTVTGTIRSPQHGQTGVYLEYWGSTSGDTTGSISMWLFLDTPDGRFRYDATGELQTVVLGDDGVTTRVFAAPYSLASWPPDMAGEAVASMPHDGVVTFTLSFWPDGTLYRSAVSLEEGGTGPA